MTAKQRIVTGAEAEALREVATCGPWSANDEHGLIPGSKPAWVVSRTNSAGDYLGDVADIPQDMGIPSGLPTPQEQADAELIAAAPDLAYTVQVQAEQIAAAYSYAQMGATTAHAQGQFESERRWLDLLHMLDQSGVTP